MKPRVALVSESHEHAGAEVYLVTLAGRLAGELELVAVLSDAAADETVERAREAGAEIARVPGLGRRPTPRSVAALARLLRRIEPALVHVNATDQGGGLAPLLALRLLRAPAVVTMHNWIPGRAAWKDALSTRALRPARRVIAVSESVGAAAARRGLPVTVIPNGVDPQTPAPDARARLGLPGGAFVVGGIGRLHRQKGWDVLAAAAPLVRERIPAARFVVVGDGPLRPELAAGGLLELAGHRPDAAALVGAFDVLAAPSRYEGFGLVVVEAMHAGVPVVASSVDALPSVVGDAGVLVPPDDPGALAAALVALAEDAGRRDRLAAAGRTRAERFTVDAMAEATSRVFRDALRAPKGA